MGRFIVEKKRNIGKTYTAIKLLEKSAESELKQIGLTPRTSFVGTQEDHDEMHRSRANEYREAAKILRKHQK